MSEQAPEPEPQVRQRQTGGNVFLRKLGPLPLWAWMGVGLGIALAYSLWKKNKAASATTSTPASATPATSQSLIPQFVNQVYNQPSPPPDVTVNNTTTPASTPPPKPKRPQLPGYPAPSDFEGWQMSATSILLHWNQLNPKPSGGYTWTAKDPSGKTKTGHTTGNEVTVNGLKPYTSYDFSVQAVGDSAHKAGDPTNVTVATGTHRRG